MADRVGEGPSSYADYGNAGGSTNNTSNGDEFAGNVHGFQSAVNARVVENM